MLQQQVEHSVAEPTKISLVPSLPSTNPKAPGGLRVEGRGAASEQDEGLPGMPPAVLDIFGKGPFPYGSHDLMRLLDGANPTSGKVAAVSALPPTASSSAPAAPRDAALPVAPVPAPPGSPPGVAQGCGGSTAPTTTPPQAEAQFSQYTAALVTAL